MDKNKNLLEMKPSRKKTIEWEKKDNAIVLKIKRDGSIAKILHKLFKTPELITIDLDDIGSFVWEQCGGEKTIYDISEDLKNEFGEKVEPVLERLLQYIKILKGNNLIELE